MEEAQQAEVIHNIARSLTDSGLP